MSDTRAAKSQQRTRLRAALAAHTPAAVLQLSNQAIAHIESLPEYAAARSILLFVPMASRPEVDLRPLATRAMRRGKRVALPRTDWPTRTMTARLITDLATDLEPDAAAPAAAGLLHPRATCPAISPSDLDLVIVPGLGFDDRGGRIGHGAGFYDRFLAQLAQASSRGQIVGVGFDVQVLPPGQTLPREPHDHPLHALVTESRVLRFGSRGGFGPAGPS